MNPNSAPASVRPPMPQPRIQGLDELFRYHSGSDQKDVRFPQGCTMVISGPPGAGKTTMALGLVRSMLRDVMDKNLLHIAYYISTEVNRERLQKMFASRGWLTTKEEHTREDNLFVQDSSPTRTSGLHVINPPMEIERPVKTSEELVNFIVRQIAIQSPPEDSQKVFIIVDSVTALFKDARSPGESRRQTHELIHRLRQQFVGREHTLGMIILLAEQGIEALDSPGMETYVADFVLNLGLKSLTMGTRLRTLEITKSQGANLMMGKHTWMIVTNQSLQRVIVGETLQKKVRAAVGEIEGLTGPDFEKDAVPWGTLVIMHRPYFFPTRRENDQRNFAHCASGLKGLDQMLKLDSDYWFGNPTVEPTVPHNAIKPGSVTILVGEAGTGKTSLSLQFVAQHLVDNPDSGKALLIGFEQDLKPAWTYYASIYENPKGGNLSALAEQCDTIFRSRSGLHFNLLLMEIRTWLLDYKGVEKRVIIDGLSNLSATHTKQDFSQMMDALITLMDQYPFKDGSKATLFLTYEASQAANIYETEAFRLPADNIVVLSHQPIEGSRRAAVTVIKSSHSEYDTMVRELALDHTEPARSHIKSGFDAYSGLLTGKVRQARVVLQLFTENESERTFNEKARCALSKLLPYTFTLREFSRFEISSTLDAAEQYIRIPGGDVLIANMDEWWLAHKTKLIEKRHAEATEEEAKLVAARKEARKYRLSNLAGMVGKSGTQQSGLLSLGDFWCFEVEKTRATSSADHLGPYAIPSFLDFGMLCVHRKLAEQVLKENADVVSNIDPETAVPWDKADNVPWETVSKEKRDAYCRMLEEFMVDWCELTADNHWFKVPDADSTTLIGKMAKAQASGMKWGFAFDSRIPETAACMLYELGWAFGGSADLFAVTSNQAPVTLGLLFLGFLVKERLMPVCPTLTDSASAAFSRHFYSTFSDVNARAALTKAETPPPLVALGFMPPGPESVHGPTEAKRDHEVRLNKLLERVNAWYNSDKVQDAQSLRTLYAEHQAKGTSYEGAKSPNLVDLGELIRWMDFRERLHGAENWKQVVGNVEVTTGEPRYVCRTGHGCCGAWMLGVKSPTASPGIAQVVLEELTSLNFAKRRARLGAGLPARQDFYRYYGDRPVTGMNYLSWSDMLRNLGSRAHRRDRIYSPASQVDPAKMHQQIQGAMDHLMRHAGSVGATSQSIYKMAGELAEELFSVAIPPQA